MAVDRMAHGFPELPADARAVAERAVACQHFAGEFTGGDDERNRQVTAAIGELKCGRVEEDLERMRRKYRKRPEVLKLLDEAAAGPA